MIAGQQQFRVIDRCSSDLMDYSIVHVILVLRFVGVESRNTLVVSSWAKTISE